MTDFSRAIGAEVRRVENRVHEGKPARVVVAERVYDTEIEDLWNAVTDKQRIPRWFAPVEGDLRLGGRYQIKGNAGGTVTLCDPPRAFDLTWEFGGGVSWVSVRLTPEGDRTRLVLEHVASTGDIPDDHWKTYGPGAVGVGWELSLMGLGLHLAQGGAVSDHAAFEAWGASEPGIAFVNASAGGWAEAHVAGGEDRDTAFEMARQTAHFYTGGHARL